MKIINVGPKTDIKITDKSDIYNSGPTYVPVQIAPLQTPSALPELFCIITAIERPG